MKWLPTLLFLSAAPAVAQVTLYLDISGPWARFEQGKPSGTLTLPHDVITDSGPYQLVRDVEIPAGSFQGLGLVMPALGGPYTVMINGVRIGGTKSWRPGFMPPWHDIVLPIPDDLLHAGRNRIEVDSQAIHFTRRSQNGAVIGPPLIAGTPQLKRAAQGRLHANQLLHFYLPFNVLAQVLFVLILVTLSVGSRHRRAMLWLVAFFLCVLLFFDLPYALEVFADFSPSVRSTLGTLARFGSVATLIESALAFLNLRLHPAIRLGYYFLNTELSSYTPAAVPAVLDVTVFAALLAVALRRRDRFSCGFLAVVTGYRIMFLHPPAFFMIGPIGFVLTPAYRVFIGVAAILLVVRFSARDRRERERLAGELEAARTVQQLLVADSVEGTEAVYRPALEVGGDFHWSRKNPDGSMLLAVGDVSGKGLRAAMLVSVAIGSLRTISETSPAAILARLNLALLDSARGGFVTAAVARLDADRVCIANAGHPAPYCDGSELPIESGIPLGLIPDARYTDQEFPLGRHLTFISDGVLEAANAKGELFGFERTREISTRTAAEIAEAARAWGQNDDITVVTVRRLG